MKNEFNILLVEDNAGDVRIIKELLKEASPLIFSITHTGSLEEAIQVISTNSFDSILLDLGLPDSVGIQTFLTLNNRFPNLATTIILTGLNDAETGLIAVNSGAQDYLIKGQVDSEKLTKSIVYSYERNRLNRELKLQLEATRVAEEQLREEELQYRNLANSGTALVWTSGTDKLCNYFNDPWLKFTGRTLEQELGNGWAEGVHPDDLERSLNTYVIAFDKRENFEMEYRLRHSSAEYRWILDMGTPNYDRSGEFTGYIGHCFDITERKQAEENLKINLTKYQVLFDSFPLGITISDKKGNILESNQKAEMLLGLSEEEQIKRQIDGSEWAIIKNDGSPFSQEEYASVRALKENRLIENIEMGIVKGENEITWINVTAAPIPVENYGVAITYSDITKRRQMEVALKESNEILSLFLKHSPIYTFIKEVTPEVSRVLKASENFIEMIGVHGTEMAGKTMQELFPPDLAAKITADDWSIVSNNKVFQIEEELNGRNYITIKYPILKQGKNLLAGYTIDITERKQAEKELLTAKEHAEESDRLKTAFLCNMSHEIRTPMNGILGFADLLKEPGLSGEQQQEYIRIIEKGGARMLNIINDIVAISIIESKQMKVSVAETDINQQLESIFYLFKRETDRKGLQLFLKNNLPVKETIIKTDQEKLYAILVNLVKNAIKYTDKGSIEFGYDIIETHVHALSPQLQFFVKDTGIGIPKDRQEAIFERFIQADVADKLAYQGAGLGLSIAKAYVEALGGNIWVESEPGEGSVFYFTIPINVESEERIDTTIDLKNVNDSQADTDSSKLKILIAEDEENSALFLALAVGILSKEQIKVKTGVEAIEVCRKNPDLDLVLMDIRMPEMDGYEATRQIRRFNKDVVIIAQTAFAMEGDKELVLEAGCNDYLSKPIKKAELVDLVKKYFNR